MFVAVYGSLRRGGPANGLMKGCWYHGKDHIEGSLFHLGPFPGFKTKGKTKVRVDIYEVPDSKTLAGLDRYEGFIPESPEQSLYNRIEVTSLLGHKVFVYEYNHPIHEDLEVKSGDWFNG